MELNWVTPKIIIDILDANSYQKKYIQNLIILNQCGLELKKLFTLCEDIYRGNTPKHVEGSLQNGALLLKTVNIRSNELDLGKQFSMTNSVYFEQKRFQLKENDICITIMGATHDIIGRSWVYNKKIGNACFSDGIAKIKNVVIDPYYLSTYLNSKYGHLSIIQFSGSSTRSYITNTQLGEILVPIPSPEIQKYVGDKVRKAEELREEAKRLKKEAEEVLNNELNVKELLIKIDRYTEKHSWIMNSDINDRMDALYYNPQKITIKKFYKNYNLQKLKDLVDYKKGYAFKSEDYCNNTSTFLLRVSDISNNEVDMCNMLNLPDEFYQEYKDFNLINGDIVMVVTGNTTGKSIVINNNKFKLLLNQNAIRMRIKEGIDISPYYIELILQSQYFQTLLKYSLYQSVQPFISMEFLNDVVIPIIDKTKIENISNLYEKSLNNLFYAKQLIQEAKQDVEDLIEGNFDMSKVKANS